MQTFLPFPDMYLSLLTLDRARLGKQRVEAKQIYLALTGQTSGWRNHPAVKMWKGYETALAFYGLFACEVWIQQGYSDSLQPFFAERIEDVLTSPTLPPWWGRHEFHLSHRMNLLRKDFTHYAACFFEDARRPMSLILNWPYWWPTQHGF